MLVVGFANLHGMGALTTNNKGTLIILAEYLAPLYTSFPIMSSAVTHDYTQSYLCSLTNAKDRTKPSEKSQSPLIWKFNKVFLHLKKVRGGGRAAGHFCFNLNSLLRLNVKSIVREGEEEDIFIMWLLVVILPRKNISTFG